ncbi:MULTISPECIES: hypothetical protein [Geobacillus]|uniref:hypothetical protein n=1 Tax=Geobacillus TaxID=129337 RepID=UPI0009C0EEA1|nr:MULTISPECIES: hypothetical protein [Geobacillus]MED3747595.1 hypothetical protein [Geobacillus stearothermophilus]MED3752227.1 hypothetical protein [Geobacillus stearothermophilus]OQP07592.1 hypothetical protein B1690_03420 [Geobacillus sp. 46C-IIa]OQP08661.1 hypothetical protein B1692_17570 [Geobacillus thermoleovorans]OQP16199.1 hypothetical protein B1693_09905 [Geobacillus zalihae]
MQIKKLSFDELPKCVVDEIAFRHKNILPIEATVMEFETIADPMYTISLLDTDRNVIVELTWMDGKITHENRIALRTVFEAVKKYPERFSIK